MNGTPSSLRGRNLATPKSLASNASSTFSNASSYQYEEQESPSCEVYDEAKAMAKALEESETEAIYDRIATELAAVSIQPLEGSFSPEDRRPLEDLSDNKKNDDLNNDDTENNKKKFILDNKAAPKKSTKQVSPLAYNKVKDE